MLCRSCDHELCFTGQGSCDDPEDCPCRCNSTISYYLPEHGQDADDPYELPDKRYMPDEPDDFDLEYIAQACAEHYHTKHDGWEASWPLLFTLMCDGRNLGTFSVDRDVAPVFSARRRKEKP